MPFGTLWLPVVVSTVVVFVASSLIHMLLRYHKADYKGLPNEDAVRDVIRKGGATAGYYVVPYCGDPSQMKDPAMAKKFADGPVAMVAVVRNGLPQMGKHLGQWFVFCLFASFVTAYVARHSLTLATDGMMVWRVTGAVSFAGYGLGVIPESIWKGAPWGNTARSLLDALIYSVLTGLTFRLLWPS